MIIKILNLGASGLQEFVQIRKIINVSSVDLAEEKLHKISEYKKKFYKYEFLQKGVSDKSQESYFYVTKNYTASSVYMPNYESLNKWRKDNFFEINKKVKCNFLSLDDLVNQQSYVNIDLLKLYIQGSEFDVLNGSLNELKKISMVIVSTNFQDQYSNSKLFSDIVSLMRKKNFYFLNMYDCNYFENKLLTSQSIFLNNTISSHNIIKVAVLLIELNLFYDAKILLEKINNDDSKDFEKLLIEHSFRKYFYFNFCKKIIFIIEYLLKYTFLYKYYVTVTKKIFKFNNLFNIIKILNKEKIYDDKLYHFIKKIVKGK